MATETRGDNTLCPISRYQHPSLYDPRFLIGLLILDRKRHAHSTLSGIRAELRKHFLAPDETRYHDWTLITPPLAARVSHRIRETLRGQLTYYRKGIATKGVPSGLGFSTRVELTGDQYTTHLTISQIDPLLLGEDQCLSDGFIKLPEIKTLS